MQHTSLRFLLGAVAIGRMYTDALRNVVNTAADNGTLDKRLAEELFVRALTWRQSAYPEPHTECEAENYDRGRGEDMADLVKILGYDPSPA